LCYLPKANTCGSPVRHAAFEFTLYGENNNNNNNNKVKENICQSEADIEPGTSATAV